MKKIMLCFLLSTILLTGCSLNYSQDSKKIVDNKSDKTIPKNSVDTSEKDDTTQNSVDTSEKDDTTQNSVDTSEKDDTTQNSVDTSEKEINLQDNNIEEEVKNYILNNQKNVPESQKIKWSERFLNQVDIENLYNQYISTGGSVNNLEEFANYITLNSPPPSNWKELFKKDLYDKYGEKVVRLEYLQDDLYQAYVKKDGSEIPYVVVSSKTGYFHG